MSPNLNFKGGTPTNEISVDISCSEFVITSDLLSCMNMSRVASVSAGFCCYRKNEPSASRGVGTEENKTPITTDGWKTVTRHTGIGRAKIIYRKAK